MYVFDRTLGAGAAGDTAGDGISSSPAPLVAGFSVDSFVAGAAGGEMTSPSTFTFPSETCSVNMDSSVAESIFSDLLKVGRSPPAAPAFGSSLGISGSGGAGGGLISSPALPLQPLHSSTHHLDFSPAQIAVMIDQGFKDGATISDPMTLTSFESSVLGSRSEKNSRKQNSDGNQEEDSEEEQDQAGSSTPRGE